jgi:hypothetical protein
VFGVGAATRIYVATGATDMRKGFDGLLSGVKYSFRLTTTIITDSCWNFFLSFPC